MIRIARFARLIVVFVVLAVVVVQSALVIGWLRATPAAGAPPPVPDGSAAVPAAAAAAVGPPGQPFSVLASDFPGIDIAQKINNASKAYAGGVRILVPAGRYPFATTIKLKPSDVLAGVHYGDSDRVDGTTLEYTGAGTAIDLSGSRELRPVVHLEDFRLLNSGKGKYGVYATWATRYFSARNLTIDGFETGLYLGECVINHFSGLHIYNCQIGIDMKNCYTVQFYSCKIDGGNPGARVNYGNLVTFLGCTFESQKGGRTIIFENGGTGNSLINCYFEDNGPKSDVYITSDKPDEGAVRLVSVEGCTFGSKTYCIELDGYVQCATIFRNYLATSGKQGAGVKISSPNVRRLSVGANIFYDTSAMLPGAPPPPAGIVAAGKPVREDRPYVENPHEVEIYPIGYFPASAQGRSGAAP